MFIRRFSFFTSFFILFLGFAAHGDGAVGTGSWQGVLRDAAGQPVNRAVVKLCQPAREYTAITNADGVFAFREIAPGDYELSVDFNGSRWRSASPFSIKATTTLTAGLSFTAKGQEVRMVSAPSTASVQATGGEHLTGGEVSSLPLNTRDFSKLLLLAAGTMTDANGAANFTQQFAVNGQRGSATVFALDGADTTDPEMGGATFSNFNVDAIEEVKGESGVMQAEIGHGAASYTNVVSKSGTNHVHGSVFEFVRNAAFDARNFFDRQDARNQRRLPPFVRNEFGFTNGGPVVIPGHYDGRNRTFYFGEFQAFRQVLGTTEVLAVPTPLERTGLDTTAFAGDTLTVPVNSEIASILARYPMPNDPRGAYGERTYATSSKVFTGTTQFSIRIDHRLSDKGTLFARFSLNQVTGPLTNPSQTAIDPSFAIKFFDHQRNAGLKYSRMWSPTFASETSLGYIRSTPFFPAINQTQPALEFGDGLYEGFNSAAGSVLGSYGNLYQLKQDFTVLRGSHAFKFGVEIRVNRDSTIFGLNPNGKYVFGGGSAYSPVDIPSSSGLHDIHVGDPLPDALTGFLTASPHSYSTMVAADITPVGNMFNSAAIRRSAFNFYFQDNWRPTSRLAINYGLRYEFNNRISEGNRRTSTLAFVKPDGSPASYWEPGARQIFLLNPQPPYLKDWGGWGPRLALDYRAGNHTTMHAGGSIVTLLPNLWQENFLTGGIPFVFSPFIYAQPGVSVPFSNSVTSLSLPQVYTTDGQLAIPNGRTENIIPNTVLDLARFQTDLAAVTPGGQPQLLIASGIERNLRNGYIGTYSAGIDHDFGDLRFSAGYIATVGVHLARELHPNGYGGASPAFAPFTEFSSTGQAIGGYGYDAVASTGSHSTYHALQTSLSKNSQRAGLGFQASYTFSKSIDDTSAVLGGLLGSSGVILQTGPQDPRNPNAEKGPSTFDVTHVFAVSLIQALPLDRIGFLQPLGKPLTQGWQFLNITTLMTGSPFTVFSGIQQTGAGAGGTDRPDLVKTPAFSTRRTVREDYFGRGEDNTSFFHIPINVPGGTGPNQGVFGTLGRGVFRGPGFQNYDIALIKDTPFGRRRNQELGILQFRAEIFNVFNLVNFSLPSNVVLGSGFGVISKTAGSSRQIQFSLKLIY